MVLDFEVDGIRSGNITYGHRFHAPGAITVRRFDDYAAKLEAAKVVLDADRRKEIILADARNLAFANGLELVEDEGLLEEVSGLVEWPVVLMGAFEEDFLAIPAEVIRLTIRANQKCFVTRRPQAAVEAEANTAAPNTASSLVPPTSRRRTAARRSSTATARWCARASPMRCISGRPTRATCPTSTTLKPSAEKFGLDLKSRSTSAWPGSIISA